MPEWSQRRLSLLYELFLATQSARRFMRSALEGSSVGGDEFAVYSYLFANGPRTLSQAARDLGYPITTLATMLAPAFERDELERRPHPRDRRARLIGLTDAGRERRERAVPGFAAAYRALLDDLVAAGVDPESAFSALAELRGAIDRTTGALDLEADRSA